VEQRPLGASDLTVSVLGLGCWPLGGGDGWGDVAEKEGLATVHAALDQGINFFDTAEGYNRGRSEEVLGKALAGRRDRALIATKVSPSNTEPDVLRKHCEASLRRLRTDHIDLYQIHWPMPPERVDGAMEELENLQREGKVRTIGISNHGVTQMEKVLWTGAAIASNQVSYSLLARAIEFEVAPACRQYGLSVIAYMALMQGLLADVYQTPDQVPAFRARTRHFSSARHGARHGGPGHEEATFHALDEIRDLCRRLGQPMARVALAWVLANKTVACVLIGSRKPAQLERNIEAASLHLSDEVIDELERITRPLRDAMGPNIDLWQGRANRRSY